MKTKTKPKMNSKLKDKRWKTVIMHIVHWCVNVENE